MPHKTKEMFPQHFFINRINDGLKCLKIPNTLYFQRYYNFVSTNNFPMSHKDHY